MAKPRDRLSQSGVLSAWGHVSVLSGEFFSDGFSQKQLKIFDKEAPHPCCTSEIILEMSIAYLEWERFLVTRTVEG